MTAESIVVLTGAGISQESGLSTFRDADGIWAKVRIEDVATPEAFALAPDRVHDFYNARRQQLREPSVKPNAAHIALAELELRRRGETLVVTQNIDDLHERAGNRNILHMHGELSRQRCAHCGATGLAPDALSIEMICGDCGEAGSLRPDVVWFGEMPYHMDRIDAALGQCTLFLSIGTSGNVYPAASFVRQAKRAGARTVELNLEPSEGASLFDETHYGPATEIGPIFIAGYLGD